jgi:hypothetical protein
MNTKFWSETLNERPLERPMRRWEDNIIKYLSEAGWKGVDWIHLGQDRDQWRILMNTLMNLRVRKYGGFLD